MQASFSHPSSFAIWGGGEHNSGEQFLLFSGRCESPAPSRQPLFRTSDGVFVIFVDLACVWHWLWRVAFQALVCPPFMAKSYYPREGVCKNPFFRSLVIFPSMNMKLGETRFGKFGEFWWILADFWRSLVNLLDHVFACFHITSKEGQALSLCSSHNTALQWPSLITCCASCLQRPTQRSLRLLCHSIGSLCWLASANQQNRHSTLCGGGGWSAEALPPAHGWERKEEGIFVRSPLFTEKSTSRVEKLWKISEISRHEQHPYKRAQTKVKRWSDESSSLSLHRFMVAKRGNTPLSGNKERVDSPCASTLWEAP